MILLPETHPGVVRKYPGGWGKCTAGVEIGIKKMHGGIWMEMGRGGLKRCGILVVVVVIVVAVEVVVVRSVMGCD
jgi:hypothetical protein